MFLGRLEVALNLTMSCVIVNNCRDTYCVIAEEHEDYVEVVCIPVIGWERKTYEDGHTVYEPIHVFSSTQYGLEGKHLCIMSQGLTDSHDGDLLCHLRSEFKERKKPLVYRDDAGVYHKYVGFGLSPLSSQTGKYEDIKAEILG